MAEWRFLTNHARVLLCIVQNPETRIRDIAACADITERAAHRILSELVASGYVEKHRLGARNFYEVHPELPLRHQQEAGIPVGALLAPLLRHQAGARPAEPT